MGTRWGHDRARSLLFLLAAAAALLAPAVPAFAGDAPAPDPVAALDAQTRQHLKDKALDAVRADVAEATKLFPAVDAKGQRTLGLLLQAVLRGTTDEAVRKATIEAIGETKDKSLGGALKPFLAQPDKKEVPPLMRPAIAAAGKLADEDLYLPLLAIVKDSKSYDAAADAIRALGCYGESKRLRQQILREVVLSVGKDQPGVGLRYQKDEGGGDPYATAKTRTSEEARARWGALSPVMVEALNKMTGQKCASPEDWMSLYDKYKGSLGTLFE